MQPQVTFLTPRGLDTTAFGATLESIGKEMKEGVTEGTNWEIAQDIFGHHQLLFGKKILYARSE